MNDNNFKKTIAVIITAGRLKYIRVTIPVLDKTMHFNVSDLDHNRRKKMRINLIRLIRRMEIVK